MISTATFLAEVASGTVEMDVGRMQPHQAALVNGPRFAHVGQRTSLADIFGIHEVAAK